MSSIARLSARKVSSASPARLAASASRRAFGTASTDDARKPTALAKLHLEDGSTFVGQSFGCHASVEGEVSYMKLL